MYNQDKYRSREEEALEQEERIERWVSQWPEELYRSRGEVKDEAELTDEQYALLRKISWKMSMVSMRVTIFGGLVTFMVAGLIFMMGLAVGQASGDNADVSSEISGTLHS